MRETLIDRIEDDALKMMLDYEGKDYAFDHIFIEGIDKEDNGICIGWRYYYDEGCRHYCETYVKNWRGWESLKKKLTKLNDVLDVLQSAQSEFYKTFYSTGLKNDLVD